MDCTSGPWSVVCEEKAGDGEQETGIGSQGAGVGERETDVRGQRSPPPLAGWLFVICYSQEADSLIQDETCGLAWRDERRSSFLCQAKLGDPRRAWLGPARTISGIQ